MLRNFLLLASTLFFFTGVGAHGAEFRMVATSGDQEEFARINLTGAIVSGDAEKLQAIFDREMSGYFFDTHYVTLTMDSLGGSFSEAIKLMDMFGRVKIATRVAKDASCLSACAVAFMGGKGNVLFSPSGMTVFSPNVGYIKNRRMERSCTHGFCGSFCGFPFMSVGPTFVFRAIIFFGAEEGRCFGERWGYEFFSLPVGGGNIP